MSQSITGGVAHGAKTGIGATAVAISASVDRLNRGICIKASPSNPVGSYLYVGGAGVTTANGFPLAPGETVTIEVARAVDLYVIGSTTNLEARWVGV